MNRTTWTSVAITGVVLCLAGLGTLAPRLLATAVSIARSGDGTRAIGRIGQGASSVPRVAAAAPVWHAPLAGGGWIVALFILVALFIIVALMVLTGWAIGRAPMQQRVLWLAARGHSASRIARQTGLAQDAVRSLLRPVAAARPALEGRQALPTGRNVRSAAPRRKATESPKWLKRRATTALGRAVFARHGGC